MAALEYPASFYHRTTRLAALVAMAGGIAVLLGWAFDIGALKRVLPGLVTMKANTALAFALAGISLWYAGTDNLNARQSGTALLSAGGTQLIGLLSVSEYLGANLGIDELLVHEVTSLPGDIPGRMSVLTAINFSLIGTALLLVRRHGTTIAVNTLALIAGAIAGSGLLGYLYATEELYRVKHTFTAMALHTSVIFLALTMGLLNARADYPFRRIMASRSEAAAVTRHLLLAAIVVPFATGWLVMAGYRAGHFGEALAISIFAAANITGLALLVLWNATLLFKAEQLRKQAEEELRRHEAQLEQTVSQRTEELHRANATLEQQTRFDFLTGVCTRRHFMELAEYEWSRARRLGDDLAVLVLDVDHFKSINDTHGHRCGDAVLARLGELLREALRDIDIVGRIGGEEFAIILPHTDIAQAMEAAERMRLLLQETPIAIAADCRITCTASIGVATLGRDGGEIAGLLHCADLALYDAKRSGRNRVAATRSEQHKNDMEEEK